MLSPISNPLSYEAMWEHRKEMFVHAPKDHERVNHMYLIVKNLLDSYSNNSRYQDGLWPNLSDTTRRDCENWLAIIKMIKAKALVMGITLDHESRG